MEVHDLPSKWLVPVIAEPLIEIKKYIVIILKRFDQGTRLHGKIGADKMSARRFLSRSPKGGSWRTGSSWRRSIHKRRIGC
jgi:hypothetical protein